MKKLVLLSAFLFLIYTERANAFIFTDLVAKIQRIQMIAQANKNIQQLNTYRNEFNKYKSQFDTYYKSFSRVYRRLSALEWKDFTPSNWARLKDHFITFFKTFDEAAWQAQVLALKTSPYYSANPDYRTYADNLIDLSEQQAVRLKREEANLIELQAQDAARYEILQRFKSRNAQLVLNNPQNDEIALSQQIALTNAILIELASIEAESKLVEQRLLTGQKEERNLIMRMKQLEIEAQKGDVRNLDTLKSFTQTK